MLECKNGNCYLGTHNYILYWYLASLAAQLTISHVTSIIGYWNMFLMQVWRVCSGVAIECYNGNGKIRFPEYKLRLQARKDHIFNSWIFIGVFVFRLASLQGEHWAYGALWVRESGRDINYGEQSWTLFIGWLPVRSTSVARKQEKNKSNGKTFLVMGVFLKVFHTYNRVWVPLTKMIEWQ